MARPRGFEAEAALDAAVACFWARGYEATSMRMLTASMGINGASLYNTFGDKRALYRKALQRYCEKTLIERIRRCSTQAPRAAIASFLGEVLDRSLQDGEHKGCMLVNSVLETPPDDPALKAAVTAELGRIERFFLDQVSAGQRDGTVNAALPAPEIARHLLGVLMGLRVMARIRPEPDLLRAVVAPALALLAPVP